MKLTERQQIVIDYLKGKNFTSPTEIGSLFGNHSAIGSPLCKRLVVLGLLKRNKKGHYRLKS